MYDWSFGGPVSDEPAPHYTNEQLRLQELREQQHKGLFIYDNYDWSGFDPGYFGWRPLILTKGYFALVSVEHFDSCRALGRWKINIQKHCETGEVLKFYAKRDSSGHTTYLHRFIAKAGLAVVVDHRNGLSLDNRHTNLQATTQGVNVANRQNRGRKVQPNLPSGVEIRGKYFKGVIQIHNKKLRSKEKWSEPGPAHAWYLEQRNALFCHSGYEGPIYDSVPLFPPRIRFEGDDIPF